LWAETPRRPRIGAGWQGKWQGPDALTRWLPGRRADPMRGCGPMGVWRKVFPNRLDKHIAALDRFEQVYGDFLSDGGNNPDKRRAVTEGIPAAQRGLDAAGAYIGIGTPPGMPVRPVVYEGLIATAFLHEQPGFSPSPYPPPTYDGVLDAVAGAKAELEEQVRERKARRWSPLYWLDGIVRVLLSIPAYIVSRVAGTSVAKIDKLFVQSGTSDD
jgi:hypothetical protein